MASTAEIMNCPEKLTSAYPGVERTRETLDLYVEMLADIPGYVLKRAVEEYLVKANWFPKISELRQAAAKVAGTSRFWELPEPQVDSLRGEAVHLEHLFFPQGILDEETWEQLADQFEQAGRGYGTERIHKKAEGLPGDQRGKAGRWRRIWLNRCRK